MVLAKYQEVLQNYIYQDIHVYHTKTINSATLNSFRRPPQYISSRCQCRAHIQRKNVTNLIHISSCCPHWVDPTQQNETRGKSTNLWDQEAPREVLFRVSRAEQAHRIHNGARAMEIVASLCYSDVGLLYSVLKWIELQNQGWANGGDVGVVVWGAGEIDRLPA